ncbi:MAG: hypothetical protein WBL06_04630 [Pseudolysinimonas sp.]|jgi:hypothetical protein|uniref:hypothetical protein n=1 Tax=Pseudolysinimonas sp. TaxID=2680009 RepID=UPI003C75868A
MAEERMRAALEIATAILLGLVSVATAFGAYQASEWSQQAGRYESIAGQLRDVSLSGFIASDLAAFDDGERIFAALDLEFEIITGTATDVEGIRDQQDAILSAATPGVLDDWHEFLEGGYQADDLPTQSSQYAAVVFAPTYSANAASTVAFEIAESLDARSLQQTIAAVVFALSLLLLGVAGTNASIKVSFALTLGGAGAFAVGVVISALAAIG